MEFQTLFQKWVWGRTSEGLARRFRFGADGKGANGRRNMAKTTGTRGSKAAAIRESEVLEAVSGLSIESVNSDITRTQVEVQKTLADLSGKVTAQLQVLETVEQAIQSKRQQIQQLHDLDAKAMELDDLNAQIATTRQAWEEEQAQKKRAFAEQQSERTKAWARQEEEYQYKIQQEHKKAEDTFSFKMAQQERENHLRQEQLERGWAERETELKKRETELTELRTQVGSFPEVVKKEVNAAVAIATNSVKKEYETKIVLASKDSEVEKRLATQETAALTATITKLNAQIEDLRATLEQAHRDSKDIAAKALESASGRAAMEALQRSMEREQPYKPGK
jgi:hypothetical protein